MDCKHLKNFCKLSYEGKNQIMKNGRPTPELTELILIKLMTFYYVMVTDCLP